MSENKEVRLYKVGYRRYGNNELFTKSKEKAIKVWEVLNEGDFFQLDSVISSEHGKEFFYPSNLPLKLSSEKMILLKDEKEAILSRDNFEKACKMKLITKKKKKKP